MGLRDVSKERSSMTTMERLRGELFQLPFQERTALVRDLLASLEGERDIGEAAASELVAIVRECSMQLDTGGAIALDWRDSIANTRSQLAARVATSS